MSNGEKKVSIFVFFLAVSLGYDPFVLRAAAADIDRLCNGAVALSIGQWASYAVDAPLMQDKIENRFAIVGAEADYYWLEYEAATPIGDTGMIMQFLIPQWPYAEGAITRVIMQMPTIQGMDPMPPIEMPPSTVQKDDLASPIRMACAELKKGVEETVTVPAGTFSALRIPLRPLGKDIWISPDVPFGMVKLVDAAGNGTVLHAFGSNAESAVTATPSQLPGMERQEK
jgi:hypothetical protein